MKLKIKILLFLSFAYNFLLYFYVANKLVGSTFELILVPLFLLGIPITYSFIFFTLEKEKQHERKDD